LIYINHKWLNVSVSSTLTALSPSPD